MAGARRGRSQNAASSKRSAKPKTTKSASASEGTKKLKKDGTTNAQRQLAQSKLVGFVIETPAATRKEIGTLVSGTTPAKPATEPQRAEATPTVHHQSTDVTVQAAAPAAPSTAPAAVHQPSQPAIITHPVPSAITPASTAAPASRLSYAAVAERQPRLEPAIAPDVLAASCRASAAAASSPEMKEFYLRMAAHAEAPREDVLWKCSFHHLRRPLLCVKSLFGGCSDPDECRKVHVAEEVAVVAREVVSRKGKLPIANSTCSASQYLSELRSLLTTLPPPPAPAVPRAKPAYVAPCEDYVLHGCCSRRHCCFEHPPLESADVAVLRARAKEGKRLKSIYICRHSLTGTCRFSAISCAHCHLVEPSSAACALQMLQTTGSLPPLRSRKAQPPVQQGTSAVAEAEEAAAQPPSADTVAEGMVPAGDASRSLAPTPSVRKPVSGVPPSKLTPSLLFKAKQSPQAAGVLSETLTHALRLPVSEKLPASVSSENIAVAIKEAATLAGARVWRATVSKDAALPCVRAVLSSPPGSELELWAQSGRGWYCMQMREGFPSSYRNRLAATGALLVFSVPDPALRFSCPGCARPTAEDLGETAFQRARRPRDDDVSAQETSAPQSDRMCVHGFSTGRGTLTADGCVEPNPGPGEAGTPGLALWNGRGQDRLPVFAAATRSLVLGIVETFGSVGVLRGWQVLEATRSGRQGGGVALAVGPGVSLRPWPLPALGSLEAVAGLVAGFGVVAVCYLPPDRAKVGALAADLASLVGAGVEIAIGDFNIVPAAVGGAARRAGLCVVAPVAPTRGKNVLDFALVQSSAGWRAETCASALGSDHRPVEFFTPASPALLPRKRRLLPPSPEHWQRFSDTLSANANAVSDLMGAEKMIVSAMNRLPHSPSGPAPKSPPFPPDVVKALAAAAQTWVNPSASPADIAAAETESRLALAGWASARLQTEAADACKDTKALFAFWRRLVASGPRRPLEPSVEDLSSAFATKHDKSVADGPWTIPSVEQYNLDCTLDAEDIQGAIAAQADGAADPCGIHPRILRHLPPAFVAALAAAATASLRKGEYPERWKHSVVVPVPKDPDAELVLSNLRPVAITALLSRIIERAVVARYIRARLVATLHPAQSGFLPVGEASLVVLVHSITETLRIHRRSTSGSRPWCQDRAAVLHVDLRDAFCRVRPMTIMRELVRLGLPWCLIMWIRGFLVGRWIQVRAEGSFSQPCRTEVGVPQGSVLGPLLFLVVADTLCRRLQQQWLKHKNCRQMHVYADDVVLLSTGPHLADLALDLSAGLKVVRTWAEEQGITLSPKSTAALYGGHPQEQRKEDKEFPLLDENLGLRLRATLPQRILGLHLDQQLHFTEHVRGLTEETRKLLPPFERLSRLVPAPLARQVYLATVLSRLRYGAAAWWPSLTSKVVGNRGGCGVGSDSIAARALRTTHHDFAIALTGACSTASSCAVLAEAHLWELDSYLELECRRVAVGIRHHWARLSARGAPSQRSFATWLEVARESALGQVRIAPSESSLLRDFVARLAPDVLRWAPPAGESVFLPAAVDIVCPTATRATLDEHDMCAYNAKVAQLKASPLVYICDGSVVDSRSVSAVDVWRDGACCDRLPVAAAVPSPVSTTAELHALSLALGHALNLVVLPAQVRILTDSRSSLEALRGTQQTSPLIHVRRQLVALASRTTVSLHFVYAHVAWRPHDAVDERAGAASAETAPPLAPSWRLSEQDEVTFFSRPAEVAAEAFLRRNSCALRNDILGVDAPVFLPWGRGRRAQTLLAQARTGVIGSLGGFAHDRVEPCPACDSAGSWGREGRTIRHMMVCPAATTWRAEIGLEPTLRELRESPHKAVAYIERWIDFVRGRRG